MASASNPARHVPCLDRIRGIEPIYCVSHNWPRRLENQPFKMLRWWSWAWKVKYSRQVPAFVLN